MHRDKIKFPFKCPVCGKSEFENADALLEEENEDKIYYIDPVTNEMKLSDVIDAHGVFCEYCGWTYDLKQLVDFDVVGDRNTKTVNEQKKDYYKKIAENSNYMFSKNIPYPKPHKCPVCEEYEFETECSYEICPICGWQDDGTEQFGTNDYSDVNSNSIVDAKKEFLKKRKINPDYIWSNFIKNNKD